MGIVDICFHNAKSGKYATPTGHVNCVFPFGLLPFGLLPFGLFSFRLLLCYMSVDGLLLFYMSEETILTQNITLTQNLSVETNLVWACSVNKVSKSVMVHHSLLIWQR